MIKGSPAQVQQVMESFRPYGQGVNQSPPPPEAVANGEKLKAIYAKLGTLSKRMKDWLYEIVVVEGEECMYDWDEEARRTWRMADKPAEREPVLLLPDEK